MRRPPSLGAISTDTGLHFLALTRQMLAVNHQLRDASGELTRVRCRGRGHLDFALFGSFTRSGLHVSLEY